MKNKEVFDRIAACKVVPVIAIDSADHAVPLGEALLAGGLPLAEITFRTASAAYAIKNMVNGCPSVCVGAGTLLTADNVQAAVDAGAAFGVAPGLNPTVIEAAARHNLPFIAGVCTPSDIERALALGCQVLKFFPAGAMGGVPMLKALLGPYGHTGVRFMPTGGVTIDNLHDYLATRGVIACGGTWIATPADISHGDWSAITARCRAAVAVTDKIAK